MAAHSPREKFFVFLVCLIVGAMISTQFRSAEQAKQSVNQQRAEDLVEKLKNAEKENKELSAKLEEMETQGAGGDRKVLNDLKIKGGEVPLHGPGVLVVVNDSKVTPKAGENPNLYVIHDDDLLLRPCRSRMEPFPSIRNGCWIFLKCGVPVPRSP